MRFYNLDGLKEHNRPQGVMDCTEWCVEKINFFLLHLKTTETWFFVLYSGDRVLRNNMVRHLETKHGISRRRKFRRQSVLKTI